MLFLRQPRLISQRQIKMDSGSQEIRSQRPHSRRRYSKGLEVYVHLSCERVVIVVLLVVAVVSIMLLLFCCCCCCYFAAVVVAVFVAVFVIVAFVEFFLENQMTCYL